LTIIGGLWYLKALFESDSKNMRPPKEKTIWIFSDMVNETRDFQMPDLIKIGPDRMLERIRTNGSVVPLNGYKVFVLGASASALTSQQWSTIKKFWEIYFKMAGAELLVYSAEGDVER
jgi:hypothetical protein